MASHRVQRIFFPLLWPLGKLYGYAMELRRRRYEQGAAACFIPSVPTVCVGNIGWGGSGKTPVVEWLLDWAVQKGLKPVVLTRGYKGAPSSLPCLVKPDSTAEEVGDEPLMLARKHPQARVVVDPMRRRSGAWAETHLSPDMFVMDDGFQHLAMSRNLDLVLLTPEDLVDEWNRVIPSGSWRENAAALQRANAILIKTSPESFDAMVPLFRKRLGNLNIPVYSFFLQPERIHSIYSEDDVVSVSQLADSGYALFSGVGNPSQVAMTAQKFIGTAPRVHHNYADHYCYTRADVIRMARDGLPLLCTPKDAVKVTALQREENLTIWTFSLKTMFGPAWNNTAAFPEWWDAAWQTMQSA